jgi:TatD DNase family protein
MLIDSHCHLDYPALAKDREGVVARARAAGVGRMVNIATKQTDLDRVVTTAEAFEDVFCTVGVHPHHADEEGESLTLDDLIKLAAHPKVVGIGETGLDYFYKHSPVEAQQKSFRQHLRAARSVGLPVVVHSRDAEEDTARILREEGAGQGAHPLTGVMHCFSSRRALAEDALALGFYISLSGILTFKKSQELRDIVRDLPLECLLVETDSPFLAPEPLRGKICEPAYVVNTARVLAEIKGVSFDDIARRTTENFFSLFSKVGRLPV